MCETIVYGIFTLCGAIIGAIIGGIIALKICDKTIRNENKNNLWNIFRKICEEFEELNQLVNQAVAQPGDEVGTGIKHKDLSDYEKNRILFLLNEIEEIGKSDAAYFESFFMINQNTLHNLLHIKDIISAVNLKQGSNIYELTIEKAPESRIVKNAQALLLKFAEHNKSK